MGARGAFVNVNMEDFTFVEGGQQYQSIGMSGEVKATPYNGVQIKRNILESERSQGCPSKSLPGQTTIRLPDKVCQPGSGLPEQTSCSVLQSVFAALGSGSYKTGAAVLPQQKHVPLWRVRRISRVLCV